MLEIPASPGPGGALLPMAVDPICVPVQQVLLGSLLALSGDGKGVLYAPGFTPAAGLNGPVYAVAGSPGNSGLQRPGDCNQDGGIDISDAVCLLGNLFLGAPTRLPCGDGAPVDHQNITLLDSNGDFAIDLSDAVSVLQFLFSGGKPPALGTACVLVPGCPELCEG